MAAARTGDSEAWHLMCEPGRNTLWLVLAIFMALGIFRALPFLDDSLSRFFFNAEARSFPLELSPFWHSLREFGLHLPRLAMLGALVWLLWALFASRRTRPADIAAPLLATLSALLGPLLIVNWTLKELWGRARPFQTEIFGGTAAYAPPGTISDQCQSNCSFVSGETAAAFWLVWLVVLVPQRWRWPVAIAVGLFGLAVSTLRIGFGRHYVSDVTVSALIAVASVTFTAWALQTARGRRAMADLSRWSNDRALRWRG